MTAAQVAITHHGMARNSLPSALVMRLILILK
jgi:hypothetical protein